jgi:glyoxylase I family protein
VNTEVAFAGAQLAKPGIDLGIVTTDLEAMTRFYRDVLGLEDLGVGPTRATSGGRVRNLRCGETVIKLIEYGEPPAAAAPPGGVRAATGYRYTTITVSNLGVVVAACERAGRPVVVPIKEIGRGVRVAIVEDPDGNWIEFLDAGH